MPDSNLTGFVIGNAKGETLASYLAWFPAVDGKEWVHEDAAIIFAKARTEQWESMPAWADPAIYDASKPFGLRTIVHGRRLFPPARSQAA